MLGDGEEPEPGVVLEEGTIRDVVYVGAITRYHVELDAGGELTVVSQNLESGSSEVLERQGSRVRLVLAAGARFRNREHFERRNVTMQRRVGRWAAATLATTVLCFMAAGCGGDDEGDAGSAGATTEASGGARGDDADARHG